MDIEMSLDDIIQKKRIRMNKPVRKGGRFGRTQFRKNENTNLRSNLKSNGNFNAKTRGGAAAKGGGPVRRNTLVADARLKIIQKTRLKITDAREKLVEMAKQSGDARLKLKKIQEKRIKSGQRPKRRGEPPLILRSVNPSIVEPTITIGDDSDQDAVEDVPVLRRTVNNSVSINRLGDGRVNDINIADDDGGDMLTDDNDNMYSSWPTSRPLTSRLMQQTTPQLKIVTHNEHLMQGRMQDEWEYRLPSAQNLLNRQPPLKRSFGIARGTGFEEEDPYRSHRNSRMSQEMKARLDTPATPTSRSMGVLSQPTAPPSQPVGHRIVVSNLQPSVTHEDIKELFEDIGPLVTSHVVRPGTAEVIYIHQKDAVAAVDAYHNRQLDGQPMKCLLVPSRPNTLSSGRVGAKYPSSTKSAVLPDISAIHKALFNK